ncbi:MAG: alpha/beta hydrolase [Actinomycetota bacterium]|nr:alpha/beta hydrolase [Actinomycetota bacterium]
MRARRRIVGLVIAVTAVIAAGCTSDSGVTVQDRTSTPSTGSGSDTTDSTQTDSTAATTTTEVLDIDPIDWGTCDDEEATDEVLECATLTVPLDYADPGGDTIDIALVRVPAESDRQGAVLFNPGGPGGSGFDFIANNGTAIQGEMGLQNFDIVGFDPRGVDRSGGISCVDDAFQDAHLYLDDTPDTPEEQALLDESEQGFTDGCRANYGDTLKFYSTEYTARDMDAMRVGMGDEQMSYIGISYGTYLGGVYASLFPDRVRAMVLDSAYEPNGDTVEEQYLTQLVGFENAFDEWAAWCEEDAACPFAAVDVGARWDALRLQLDENPLTDEDGRPGNQSTMDTATTAALYSESAWPLLADALARAEDGDPSGILSLADDYVGRSDDGTFASLFQSHAIIQCASGIVTQPADDPEGLLAKIKEQAPRFGGDITLEDLVPEEGDLDGCTELVGETDVVELDYAGDGPILVVGGTNDPATPIRWAEEMTAELGPNAVMLTFTGEGHGQMLRSTCVTDVEATTLTDLELPDEGTVCDPDPAVEEPAWWGNLPIPAEFSEASLPALTAMLGISDTLGFASSYTTPLDLDAAAAAADSGMAAADFQMLDEFDLEIDGSTTYRYFSPDSELLIVIVLGPEAFDTEELSSAKTLVPDGESVVIYLYVPS